MSYYGPIVLLVVSNIVYHLCAKSTPQNVDPFAALTVTYAVGAVISAVFYFVLNKQGNLSEEYRHINWATLVMGLIVVMMEFGSISMYKAGWNINSGQLLYSSILSVCLVLIGYLIYHETLTPTKLIGILLCMTGVWFINK